VARDLRMLPKAHLHLHLDGAVREQTLRELFRKDGIEPPQLPTEMRYSSFSAFMEVIEACHDALSSPENLNRVIDEVVEDAAVDGAVWIELSLWPGLFAGRLGSDKAALTTALDAGNAAAMRHGIGFGLMVAANRHAGPDTAASCARAAGELSGQGVVSFGLDGDEAAFPPDAFAEAFDIARSAELLSTPHAGELLGPDSVTAAVDLLGANRILHGVRAVEDPALVRRLADADICLDVCPTSNVKLGVFEIDRHPLPALLAAGVPCSVNADDPLLFGVGLLDEYELCRTQFLLSDEELAGVAQASIRASAAPVGLKTSAIGQIAQWLDAD
jgi:adenosine deaminase